MKFLGLKFKKYFESFFNAINTEYLAVNTFPIKSPKIKPSSINLVNPKKILDKPIDEVKKILLKDRLKKYLYVTHHSLKQLKKTKDNAQIGAT